MSTRLELTARKASLREVERRLADDRQLVGRPVGRRECGPLGRDQPMRLRSLAALRPSPRVAPAPIRPAPLAIPRVERAFEHDADNPADRQYDQQDKRLVEQREEVGQLAAGMTDADGHSVKDRPSRIARGPSEKTLSYTPPFVAYPVR